SPLALGLLGDVVGDGVLGDDPGDQKPLAVQDHERSLASALSAHTSRLRVSAGSTISSMNPAAAAASARRCSSVYAAARRSRSASGSGADCKSRRLYLPRPARP